MLRLHAQIHARVPGSTSSGSGMGWDWKEPNPGPLHTHAPGRRHALGNPHNILELSLGSISCALALPSSVGLPGPGQGPEPLAGAP